MQIRDGEIDLDEVLILLAREDRYQNLAMVMGEATADKVMTLTRLRAAG